MCVFFSILWMSNRWLLCLQKCPLIENPLIPRYADTAVAIDPGGLQVHPRLHTLHRWVTNPFDFSWTNNYISLIQHASQLRYTNGDPLGCNSAGKSMDPVAPRNSKCHLQPRLQVSSFSLTRPSLRITSSLIPQSMLQSPPIQKFKQCSMRRT